MQSSAPKFALETSVASTSTSTSELFSRVYEELRSIAGRMMLSERVEHTLSATALVNEAYIRLSGGTSCSPWNSRGHFMSAAVEAMRRILIDRARAKNAAKRSAKREWISVESLECARNARESLLLELDCLLEKLERQDPIAAEFLKLRLYAGFSVVDAGAHLGLNRWSAYKLWEFAQAWFEAHRDDLN